MKRRPLLTGTAAVALGPGITSRSAGQTTRVKRIGVLVAVAALFASAHAQPTQKIARVGILAAGPPFALVLPETLRGLGYVADKNVVYELRWSRSGVRAASRPCWRTRRAEGRRDRRLHEHPWFRSEEGY